MFSIVGPITGDFLVRTKITQAGGKKKGRNRESLGVLKASESRDEWRIGASRERLSAATPGGGALGG
jgi:hypothetical protein